MKDPKPRFQLVTDPDEIENIQRNGPTDIVGACISGYYYAYSWSLERWRAKRRPMNETVVQKESP